LLKAKSFILINYATITLPDQLINFLIETLIY